MMVRKAMRQWKCTSVFVVFAVVLFAVNAQADRMTLHELGSSPVSYVEHRNSVNDSSGVAWTELQNVGGVGTVPRARFTDGATAASPGWPGNATTDLHQLLTSAGGSYTSDTLSRAEDINDAGDIAGYATDTPLEFRRHATLWLDTGGSWQVIDLHAAVESDPVIGGNYALTAAYGVSERFGGYVYVAGYVRETLEVGSAPAVWRVNASTGAVEAVYNVPHTWLGGTFPGTGYNYGIMYDVVARTVSGDTRLTIVGGAGGQDSGAYMHAYWFDLNVDTGMLEGSGFVPGMTSYATSGVNRVEVLDGTPVAVGYALAVDGTASAFTWEFGAPSAEVGGALTSGDIALGMGIGMRTDDAAIPGEPQVVGTSTAAAGGVGTANASTPLRAFTAYVNPEANLARTCDLNESFASATDNVEIATDINASGEVVGWSGANAVFASTTFGIRPELRFYQRINAGNDPVNFWWVEMDGVTSGAGRIIYGDEPGCFDMAECNGGTGSLSSPVGFIYDGATNTTVPYDRYDSVGFQVRDNSTYPSTGSLVALSTNAHWNNDAWSGFEPNRLNPAVTGYAQGFASSGGVCHVTDVYDMENVTWVTNPCHDRTDGWWAPRGVYRDCVAGGGVNAGCESDLMIRNDHCGACGAVCNAACYSGGGSCSSGVCTGTPNQDAWEPPESTYYGGAQEFQTVWFLDSLTGIRPGYTVSNPYPTIFPIDDVDEYLFVVNDEYQVGGSTVLDGGTPTGDNTSQYGRRGPTAHLTAPANQSLRLCAKVFCERGGDLLRYTTKAGNGVNLSDSYSNNNSSPPAGLKEHEYCVDVPAGGTRFIERRADCGPGASDPNGLDDGILTLVSVSHVDGSSTCAQNGAGPYYRITLGNRMCRVGSGGNRTCQALP